MSHPSSSFDWDDLTFHARDDRLADDQRWSTWDGIERLCRGPEPWPDWLVTCDAIDTDLGVLKTGKEADVSLLERTSVDDPGRTCLLAAKRYRATAHRLFHRGDGYTEGRRIRNTRDTRAMARKSEHGRAVESGLWATAEWEALKRLFLAGVPVPYPVQVDGSEILMEYIADGDGAAPRLHQTRPSPAELDALFEQLLGALWTMAGLGLVHGDLSPYNTLVTGVGTGDPRLVVIDVPQLTDLYANPNAESFLHRDCTNMAAWFTARGHEVDPDALFAEVISQAW
ncbi:MAG: RIO1 family regulatory kinase/ATPase [Propionicimonas sp.]|uniref:serine protein kinase RIO n=1 Tax=Propionicimonas sp. TaxID=1955623 RepID=UPI003D09C3CE